MADLRGDAFERLERALEGLHSGSTTVVHVRTKLVVGREDDSEYLLALLQLSPPPLGAPTWPIEEVVDLLDRAVRLGTALDLGRPVRAIVEGTSHADDQAEDEAALDRALSVDDRTTA